MKQSALCPSLQSRKQWQSDFTYHGMVNRAMHYAIVTHVSQNRDKRQERSSIAKVIGILELSGIALYVHHSEQHEQ